MQILEVTKYPVIFFTQTSLSILGVPEVVTKSVSSGSCTFRYYCPAIEPGEWKTNSNQDKSPGRSYPY